MRKTGFSLAALIVAATIGGASAMPLMPLRAAGAVIQIQMRCTPSSCVDARTGVYTQSTCDRYGCRPIGGPVGRVGGRGSAYDNGYDDRPARRRGWDDGYDDLPRRRSWDDGRGYRGGGGFDCNASRCIEIDTGRVWESSCDRRGCRPLRPARGYR